MNSEYIKVASLAKAYQSPSGELKVIKNAFLSAGEHETLAVMGPSGSGKSTFLHLLCGLLRPDAGSIKIGANHLESMSADEIRDYRARNIGMIFQQHHLLEHCTVFENVLIPTIPILSDPDKAATRAESLLKQLNLENRLNHFPGQLSGGEKLRVAIARALINEPALILADEPTGSVEPELGREIISLLASSRSCTLIVVTHADYVAEVMNRRFRLINGELKEQK